MNDFLFAAKESMEESLFVDWTGENDSCPVNRKGRIDWISKVNNRV